MKSISHSSFEKELAKSEKRRTSVLTIIFFISTIFAGCSYLMYRSNDTEEFHRRSIFFVFVFLLCLTVFELCCTIYLTSVLKKPSTHVPLFKQYINATIELSSPVIIILLMANEYTIPVKVLHSPVVYTYFIFIILSTLRLNAKLSLYLGMLAAAEFLLLSLYFGKLTMTAATKEGFILTTVAKSTILFLSGAGAACVAHQVKTTILRSLTAIEKENKTANLFGQQISKEVVQKILESDGALQSRLMNVCVMFIDIRNFTRHVDGKTPIEIVEYQNAFFKIVIEAVIKHHGIINQFLGDGCMVTFGAPVTLPNPCANAVAAAVEIKNQLSKENRSGVLPFSSIGIGIHTGDAVTGNIGTKERQQYSITGSVVILASRIEQLNKQYNSQILISENVVEMIPENIKQSALFLGRAELKGWHDRIAIYKVA